MYLMRYRPERYEPLVAGWISLSSDAKDSMDDAAKVIGQKRDSRPMSHYRVVVTWEEM